METSLLNKKVKCMISNIEILGKVFAVKETAENVFIYVYDSELETTFKAPVESIVGVLE
jgi:hypothetical protein